MPDLTTEERERIYLEEKAKIEAQERIKAESISSPDKEPTNPFWALLVCALVGWAGYSLFGGTTTSVSSQSQVSTVCELGDVCTLHGKEQEALVFVSLEAANKSTEAATAKDLVGQQQLLDAHEEFFVPNGTRVKSLGMAGFMSGIVKFRFVGGTHNTEIGYTIMEALQKE